MGKKSGIQKLSDTGLLLADPMDERTPAEPKGPGFLEVMDAIMLAMNISYGRKDRSNREAVLHLFRVGASDTIDTPEEQIVGMLHDVVEDGYVSMDYIREEFGNYPTVVEAIDAITRRQGERYFDYIERVIKNPIATKVKRADLLDNMNRKHPSEKEKASLMVRYRKALDMVERAIAERRSSEGVKT